MREVVLMLKEVGLVLNRGLMERVKELYHHLVVTVPTLAIVSFLVA